MKIFKITTEFTIWRRSSDCANKSIGFVPTMGNLHQGHMALLEKSLQDNQLSVFSIFVNPTQFSEFDELEDYPRTFTEDVKLINELHSKYPEKEIVIFVPENTQEIYPEGFDTVITIPSLSQILEGQFRPTHFDGVCTVVYLLFKLVMPMNAYFGKKDYQQYIVIKKMVANLMMDINIIGLPIVREDSGLALSTRNLYLSQQEKKDALIFHQCLLKLRNTYLKDGLVSAQSLANELKKNDKSWNYLVLKDGEDLAEINEKTKEIVIVGTYQIQSTRLLDNETVPVSH
jgi:pantoate--beta-alanine ligase